LQNVRRAGTLDACAICTFDLESTMTDAWSNTVAFLAGSAIPTPAVWPLGRTRRVALWDNPVAGQDSGNLSELERSVLQTLLDGPMCGGEVAYRLGIELEAAYARISRLHARGLLIKRGREWECSHRGREAAQVL
jgi:hypothetical protein